ncbi:MAG: hypothetical protein HOZ81_44860 [Streptomyces sp.]|nr:hypothetical protein [Streptomyces sp.]NUT27907.1 hypothetical protein [Streptomyces sp.]
MDKRNRITKLAVVAAGLVGFVGVAVSVPVQAASTEQNATVNAVSAEAAQESAQSEEFDGTISAFKDDYLELATDGEVMRFSLIKGTYYCGAMIVGAVAKVVAHVDNGEYVAERIAAVMPN